MSDRYSVAFAAQEPLKRLAAGVGDRLTRVADAKQYQQGLKSPNWVAWLRPSFDGEGISVIWITL